MTARPIVFGNPDHAKIHGFHADGGRPLAMDSNPLARALRCELMRVDMERGAVDLGFDPDPLFIQGTGVVQGGAISAMLDFAMAFALMARLALGKSCSTVNIHTSFLRPAPRGRYRALGELERCGRTLAFTNARLLRSEDDVLVATASSAIAIVDPTLNR